MTHEHNLQIEHGLKQARKERITLEKIIEFEHEGRNIEVNMRIEPILHKKFRKNVILEIMVDGKMRGYIAGLLQHERNNSRAAMNRKMRGGILGLLQRKPKSSYKEFFVASSLNIDRSGPHLILPNHTPYLIRETIAQLLTKNIFQIWYSSKLPSPEATKMYEGLLQDPRLKGSIADQESLGYILKSASDESY